MKPDDTTMTFTVRLARPEERAAARELVLAAYAEFAEVMAPSAWAGLNQAIQGALASDAPRDHVVAVEGDRLVGSVMLFPASGGDTAGSGGRMVWPELRMLAVAPDARGRGIGEALVLACVERARTSGAEALGLYTSESMRVARAMYERLGFTRIPQYDFQPPGAELITAYKYPLS